MVKQNVIKKIVIDIAGTTLELSLEQAKELRDILAETFPKKSQEPIIIKKYIKRDDWPWRKWRPFWYETHSTLSGNEKFIRPPVREPRKNTLYLSST